MKKSTTLLHHFTQPLSIGVILLLTFSVIIVALYQRSSGVLAPTAPQSQPRAAFESANSCTLSFTIAATATPTPTPIKECNSTCDLSIRNSCPTGLVCWDSLGTGVSGLCRLGTHPQSAQCLPATPTPTPSLTPTPTPSSTPTPTPYPQCNQVCFNTEDCQVTSTAKYICHLPAGSRTSFCRLAANPESTTCLPATPTPTLSPTPTPTPTPTPSVTPTPTPSPAPVCNSICTSNSDCQIGTNGAYSCYAPSGSQTAFCRLTSHPTSATCLTATPTPTPSLTPTPSPIAQNCNQTCSKNADCRDTNHICYETNGGTKLCRLASNPSSETCSSSVATATPTITPTLPKAGNNASTTTAIIVAGVIVLVLGAVGLMLLL